MSRALQYGTAYAFLPKNASLSLPAESNIAFCSSSKIAPNFHVGPRTYNDFGYVPNPLDTAGQIPQSVFPDKTFNDAGMLTTAPGGLDAAIGFPHYISINGRSL